MLELPDVITLYKTALLTLHVAESIRNSVFHPEFSDRLDLEPLTSFVDERRRHIPGSSGGPTAGTHMYADTLVQGNRGKGFREGI